MWHCQVYWTAKYICEILRVIANFAGQVKVINTKPFGNYFE